MSYQVSYSGRSKPGSDKIRYYQSPVYAEKSAPAESYIVTGAYSQGSYAPSAGYYTSTSTSVPRSARKYEVGESTRRVTPGNSRTCLIIVFVVGIAILVAAAIALGIVFGVVNKGGDKKADTPTTTPRPATAVSYDVSLTLDRPYISAYGDPTSTEYQNLESELLPGVTSALTDSDLGSGLIDVKLLGIEEGSVIPVFRTYFLETTVTINNQNVALSASSVQTILVEQLNKKPAFIQAQKLQVQLTTVRNAANNGRKDLGESCSSASECEDTGVECTGSKCTCMSSYYHSNNNPDKGGRCIRKISYGGTGCSESRHCATPDAVCSSATCTCNTNERFYKGNACIPKIPMYEKGCGGVDSSCVTPGAECRSEICRCPISRFYDGAQCVNKIAINTAGCSDRFQCATSGAVCEWGSGTGVCKCPVTHTYKNGRCVNSQDCATWYNSNAIWMNCLGAATKIAEDTPEGKCWHYENYMGCVKYSALIQDVECSMATIDTFNPDVSICPGHDYAYLESLMPALKSGLCTNWPSARYMIRYSCLTYDPELLSSDEDRCRALLTLQGCVYRTLNSDAGCDMTDVAALMKHSEVRSDLLDDIPTDCDTRLQLTECEKLGLQKALVNQHCLYAPTQLQFATILSDVDSFNNYNAQKKLKCSIYEESLKCLITSAGGALNQCSAASLAGVVKSSAKMFHDIMAKTVLPAAAVPLFKTVDYTDCDAALSTVVVTDQCPSSATVTDLVVASCMAQVFEATRVTKENSCLKLPEFEACVNNLHLPNADKCRENHIWTSISDHIVYVRTTIDGFDPIACKVDQDKKCSPIFVEKAKTGECKGPYNKMVDPKTADALRCRHFEAFLNCVKFHTFLFGESCSYETIRDLVRSSNPLMNDKDICYACNFPWMVKDNTGKWSGMINVRLETLTQSAEIAGMAYGLATNGLEYVGIGISENNLMSESDIYTIQPFDASGEIWNITDRYASVRAKPGTDVSQGGNNDITVKFLMSVNNVGIATFTRKIDTGDTKDLPLSGSKYLLFARGPMKTENSVLDIDKHTFKTSSDEPMAFTCSPFPYLESNIPATKEATCTNMILHRHLWEYDCLPFDFSVVPDPLDRCRTEISRRQCVFNIFQESGLPCTLNDVVTMSQLPVVRVFLLDHVDIGCESQLPDTECEKSYMFEAAENAPMCFSPIHSLNSFVFFDKIEDIEGYMSADGQKKLKCSIFEEHLKCYLSKVPRTSAGTVCTPAQIAPAVARIAHISFYINFNHDAARDKPELSYQSCEAAIPTSMPQVPDKACPSQAAVADMVLAKCGPLVLTALDGSSDNICERAGAALKPCLEDFYMPNGEMCGKDHLERSLEAFSDVIAGRMGGFNYRTCNAKDCGTWYYANAIWMHCLGAAAKIGVDTPEGKCWHYEQYMGCVKYNALVNDVECSMELIDSFAPDNSPCPGHDYTYLESLMPAFKSGLCTNAPTVRYMIRYNCLTYDPEFLSSDEDRCRALLVLQGCVYNSLHSDAGCDMTDVVALMKHSDVRSDLLDDIPTDCDTRFQLTECEKLGLQTSLANQHCFYALTQFHFATILSDVDSFDNYNAQKKLKCSVYEESLKCLIASAGGALNQCSAASLATMMKSSARMFHDVAAKMFLPAEAVPLFKTIDFTDCDAALSTVVATDQCPSSGTVADLVVASCMSQVFEATRYTKENSCLKLPAFQECVNNLHLPNADKCRENHIWTSITEHIAYIRTTADGFDPIACEVDQKKKCSVFFAQKAKYEECKTAYYKMVDPSTEAAYRCRHFEAFLSCIKFHTLLSGESCPYEMIKNLVRSTNPLMNDKDICYACDYPWMVKDNTGKWSGFVNVRLETLTQNAVITGIAYGLAVNGPEYVGIGISQNNLMSQSDIYTVQPVDSSGEAWVITDRYATAQAKPGTDVSQGGNNDITVKLLESFNNVGIAVFTRKIDTRDTKDIALSGSKYLLFARGPMKTENFVLDIDKHTFKTTSDEPMPFTCSPFPYLETSFPATKAATCTNIKLHRHLWEYECLPFDFSVVPDPLDRCRTEISRRQCVFNIFKESGLPCTLDDVVTTSQLPLLRAGLLDHVDIGCESLLPDTECEKSYMFEAAESAPMCFSFLQGLNSYVYFDQIENIENYMSADGQKKLKCSIFEEHLKCYLGKVPRTSTGTLCTPVQYASIVTRSAHISFYISFNSDAGRDKPELSYESCEAAIPTSMPQVPDRACPSQAAVADIVIAVCGPRVLTALGGNTDNMCERAGAVLKPCLEDFSMPNGDLCPREHLARSLEEYSDFIAGHMGGFHYKTCIGDQVPAGCTKEYIQQMQYDSICELTFKLLTQATDEWEKCRMFENFLGCVKFQLTMAGLNCPVADLEMKAKESATMAQYSMCKVCDMAALMVSDTSTKPPSEVHVTVGKKTEQDTLNEVVFTVKAYGFDENNDWVGIGVSYDSSMPRSDVYTIQKKAGEWVVTDRHVPSNSYSKPQPDNVIGGTSDASLTSAEYINGNLIVKFTRKVNTGDSKDVTVAFDRQLLYARGKLSGGDISKHTFKTASPLYQFSCSPYEYFESTFPKTLAEVCTFAPSIRLNLQTYCLPYDISLIHTEVDRCRAELGRRHCVYRTFQPIGCMEDQINELFQTPEVRLGLLDHINPGCETSLPGTRCEKYYFSTADLTGECMSPLISFYGYAAFTVATDAEVNNILSFDQSKLKCRVLEETMRCMLLKVPGFMTANDANSACTPASVAPAMQDALRIYYQVAAPTVTVRTVSFQDCLAEMPTTYPTRMCPSDKTVVDTIAAACTSSILNALDDGVDAACVAFNKCYKDLAFEGEELCAVGYFDNVLQDPPFKEYLKSKFSGVLDPTTCRG